MNLATVNSLLAIHPPKVEVSVNVLKSVFMMVSLISLAVRLVPLVETSKTVDKLENWLYIIIS